MLEVAPPLEGVCPLRPAVGVLTFGLFDELLSCCPELCVCATAPAVSSIKHDAAAAVTFIAVFNFIFLLSFIVSFAASIGGTLSKDRVTTG
jgi:hypothetical protein